MRRSGPDGTARRGRRQPDRPRRSPRDCPKTGRFQLPVGRGGAGGHRRSHSSHDHGDRGSRQTGGKSPVPMKFPFGAMLGGIRPGKVPDGRCRQLAKKRPALPRARLRRHRAMRRHGNLNSLHDPGTRGNRGFGASPRLRWTPGCSGLLSGRPFRFRQQLLQAGPPVPGAVCPHLLPPPLNRRRHPQSRCHVPILEGADVCELRKPLGSPGKLAGEQETDQGRMVPVGLRQDQVMVGGVPAMVGQGNGKGGMALVPRLPAYRHGTACHQGGQDGTCQ